MLESLECIALRTIRVSDKKDILSVWSRSHGRLTFAVSSGAGRTARRRRALTAPLCLFACVSDIRPDREIYTMRGLEPMEASLAMTASPSKTMTAMFLAESLDLLLRRTESDDALSNFLFESIAEFGIIESPGAIAAFHLIFLFRLMHFGGILPDLSSYASGMIFDLREGQLRRSLPLHNDYLDSRSTRILAIISRTSYASAGKLKLSREVRKRALDIILQYYSLHLGALESIKSLHILRSMIE